MWWQDHENLYNTKDVILDVAHQTIKKPLKSYENNRLYSHVSSMRLYNTLYTVHKC